MKPTILLAFLFLTGCDLIKVKVDVKDAKGKSVARVNETYLYVEDVDQAVPENLPAADSLARAKAYVDRWVMRQLFVAEAMKDGAIDKEDIERKVADYRNSLIEQQFRQRYLAKHLVDQISEQEIEAYYQQHQEVFPLRHYIIKGTYVKLSRNSEEVKKIKQLINAKDEKSREVLKSYFVGFASSYYLSDLNWIDFDQLVFDSPFAVLANRASFFEGDPYHEAEDNDFFYALKIDQYRAPGDISPLQFVREDIRGLIISERREALVARQQKEIYDQAREHEDFQVYDQ